MKIHSLLILLFSGYASCNTINNVRLVHHTRYAIDVLTRTMNIVEQRGWSNLKLHDYTFQINDDILNSPTRGTLAYTEGFVTSIQHVDIVQNTVQQVWRFNASAESTHTVSVQARLRLLGLAVGFDVTGHMLDDDQIYRYTVNFVHPVVSYDVAIIKDLHTDALSVTVQGIVPTYSANQIATTLLADFSPKDDTSDMFLQTFDPNAATPSGILAWGPEVFQPIILNVVNQIPFPQICYNCPVAYDRSYFDL